MARSKSRKPRKLSYSQINTWTRCRQQWHLQYERALVPRIERPSLEVGTAVHAGLAAFLAAPPEFRGSSKDIALKEWFDKRAEWPLSEQEREILDQQVALAHRLVDRTIKEIDIGHRWEVVLNPRDSKPLVECRFDEKLPVRGWAGFVGYLDWVGRDLENGNSWLIDFKCRETFQTMEAEEYNIQMAIYQALLRSNDVFAAGSMAWQIKAHDFTIPKQNKDETFSRAQIFCDWETYAKTVTAAGQNPDDYLDMRDKLANVESSRLCRAYRSDAEIVSVWDQIVIPAAKDIANPKKQIYRTMHFLNCNNCTYKNICLGALRGDDVNFLEQAHYRHRSDEPPKPQEMPDFDENA